MSGQLFAVAIGGLAAVWFAVAVFRTSSMVRSAFALLASMAAIGGIFLALEAEFLGVLQLMMMATEMAIMAVFMVMFMMDPGGLGKRDMSHPTRPSIVAGAVAGLVTVVVALLSDWGPVAPQVPSADEQTRGLGLESMTRSLLVFEMAAVTILVAMIAAVVVAVAKRP